jgi:DNA-binding transcriptional ArsR family regulator
MIEYELEGMDLGEVRFAISPLNELTLSLRTMRDPGRYPLQLPWLRLTEEVRADLDNELLLALTDTRLWTPDFLNPRPVTPLARLEDEFAAIHEVPLSVVREDLAEVHRDGLPAPLRGRTDRVLRRIVRALTDYWDACFAPWWPRMRTVLQADIVHRGHVIGRDGLAAMFGGLSPTVTLIDNVVQIQLASNMTYRRSTADAGLTLVPTLFSRGASTPISPDEPPMIMYGARGIGALWEAEAPATGGALVGLIGQARARLLTLLGEPASSTELAVRLGVTPTAVNQHLRAMRAAGLLTTARHGRSVLYLRSDLGDRLVATAA